MENRLISFSFFIVLSPMVALAAQPKSDASPIEISGPPIPVQTEDTNPEPSDVLSIVRLILDEKASDQQRNEAISKHPELAADLIIAIASDMKAGTEEESRRIPWLWKIAFQAGKRNDSEQVFRVLDVGIPQDDKPLTHWQAVVVGGGIINGLSDRNIWPAERINEILADDSLLLQRWERAVRMSERIAQDKSVSNGTRYDALRMIAMDKWENCRETLGQFLVEASDPELQMGAVAGLVDNPAIESSQALIDSLPKLDKDNRKLAIAGLMRGNKRPRLLLEKIESGNVQPGWLEEKQVDALKDHASEEIKRKAKQLFPIAGMRNPLHQSSKTL